MFISVNFGCFSPSRFSHFRCNAMRKAIKAHKNLHTIQQTSTLLGSPLHLPNVPPQQYFQQNTLFRLSVKLEGHCSVEGFKLLADILPMDELVYPKPEEDLEKAKGLAGERIGNTDQ